MTYNILDTYSRANERVTGERTGVQGSSHSGSGLISSGAGLPEARYTYTISLCLGNILELNVCEAAVSCRKN